MNHYLITLIFGDCRLHRHIIAASAMKATQVGAAMLPEVNTPHVLICKPVSA